MNQIKILGMLRRKWQGWNFLRHAVPGSLLLIASAGVTPALADAAPAHGIVAAHIGVEQLGFENAASNIAISNKYSIGDFRIRSSANKGDYDVQIGELVSDDVEGGVLITSISENGGRDNLDQFGSSDPIYPGVNSATSHIDYSRNGANAGGYFIPVAMTYPNSAATTVVEYNLNVTAAWFPYNKWLGAFIRNSGNTNGGVNNLISGSPELVLGTHFIDGTGGRATVDLTTLGIHSQRDGVLLVVGAKNEDNYALSMANENGTWSLFSKDNGTDGASLEHDPFAFVYVPKTNDTVISGRFRGDGTVEVAGGSFTISPLEEGRWELKIPGRSPSSGVLIISPEGGMAQNRDNIVSFEENETNDGWVIESRDLPNSVPLGETMPPLETPGSEPVASFVFIPGPTPGFTVTPTNNVFTTENGGSGSFSMVLDTAPASDVVVAFISSNTDEGLVSPSEFIFTPADWNIPQVATITGVDDTISDGPTSYHVAFSPASSTDADYHNRVAATVTVTNLDNDGAITINPTAGLVTTEGGGTATFAVHLDVAPTADVTIAFSSSNPAEGIVIPTVLTFSAENWNQDQTVTVTGVDDATDDGEIAYTIVTSPASSADPAFQGKNAADVGVINHDDDTSAVLVNPTSGLQVVENGGTATYTIALSSRPAADVVISAVTGSSADVAVSPSNHTFNASNWDMPLTITLTGMDDLVADGSVNFTITNALNSNDPLYAVIKPLNVTGTTLDNEAQLKLFQEDLVYGLGEPGKAIAGMGTIIDTNTASYDGTTLSVALEGNGAADRLQIRNIGNEEGQIATDGNQVKLGGINIGSFSGGVGAEVLIISFNTSATAEAAQTVLRNITYQNSDTNAPSALRKATITLRHGDGGTTSASRNIRTGLLRASNFQEGADHGHGIYSGAKDIELYELRPDTAYPRGRGNAGLFIDWRDPDNGNAGNILLRFDNIIGDAAGQIPTNAIIVSAELFLDINDAGDASPLYRMLQTWDAENETWNSIGGGLTPDDIRLRSTYESQIGVEDGSGATTVGTVWVSVTPDVQAWVSGGEANHGWGLPAWPLRLDGTGFSPSEADEVTDRPRLRVQWLPGESATVASFRQGENEYAGMVDTRIRQVTPDTDFTTATTFFVDALVSGTDPNPEQVFLKFDEIIGNGPGQVPPGSRIHAAILEVASLNGDAMGDGGTFHALLKPWPETLTWNGWEEGVQTNNMEAATLPSALAGNAELNPDVQGGFLSFDFTRDVHGWVSGTLANHGWVIMPWMGGNNGWGFFSSENGTERNRPRLRVFFSPETNLPVEVRMEARFAGQNVQITFNGEAGKTYSILRAGAVNGPWTKLGTVTATSLGTFDYTDMAPPAGAAFYKVSQP